MEKEILVYGPGELYKYKKKNFLETIKYIAWDFLKNKHCIFHNKKVVKRIIETQTKNGQIYIDTSEAYCDAEECLGKWLKNVERSHFYISTKISNKSQRESNAFDAIKLSLRKMKLDYVDLYLMHWPQTGTFIKTWKEMVEVQQSGLAKEIGVCNCNVHHLVELYEATGKYPSVNQIECHPLFLNEEVLKFCYEHNIKVMAYTPTGRMNSFIKENRILNDLAFKYSASIAQIILRWHIDSGRVPVVNTYNEKHYFENNDIFKFKLTDEDVKSINTININKRLRYDPDNCDFYKL